MAAPLPIAVLVSGAGTNLQALIDTVHGREAQIVGVASSRADASGLQRAAAAGIESAVFARADFGDRAARDAALGDWLLERGARLLVLAGYMELLGGDLLARLPDGVINVHPSLLPAFPGLDAVGQALAYGVKVFGVTVHYVDDGVDTGPVILQASVALASPASADEVMEHLRPLEHDLLPRAVRLVAEGRLRRDAAHPRLVRVVEAAG